MNILISSHRYFPDVGGIETTTARLAAQWRSLGHKVEIVTASLGPEEAQVHRRPSPFQLWRLVANCDVCWHNNISLQTAWPLAVLRRPWIVTTQCWLHDVGGVMRWNGHLKRLVLRHAQNVYISRSVADHVDLPGEIIPNPYDASVFRRIPGVVRDREVAFLGRLVSDKGAEVAIRALHRLGPQLRPRLSIIGGGPEESALRALCAELGVEGQVTFTGWLSGDALANALNAHRVLVVPSIWNEPFGLVAVEGIACGCTVIASNNGGLAEAVGPGGILFATGDADELAAQLRRVLTGSGPDSAHEEQVRAHLVAHRSDTIAAKYVKVFEAALERRK